MDKRTFLKSTSLLGIRSLVSFSAIGKITEAISHLLVELVDKHEASKRCLTMFKMFVILFLFSTISSNAQVTKIDSDGVVVDRIEYNENGICYYLPKNVSNLLDSIGLEIRKMNSHADYYMELSMTRDTIVLYGRTIDSGFDAWQEGNGIKLLLASSHRYVLVNDSKVPIYIETDIRFGYPSIPCVNYSFYIKFTGRKGDPGKIIAWVFAK